MFSDKRIKASMEAKCFKCGASEMLAIYPLLRYFVEVVVVASGALAPESASYVELCGVVDLMQRAKLHGVDAETLRGIRDKSRELFKLTQAAYGTEHIMPKHHYFVCPTFTRQAEEDGVWMDCFPTERKGICIKNGLDPCDNTTSYERSTLLRALAHNFGSAESGMVDGLLGFAMHCPVLSSALGVPTEVSRACCYHGLSFGIGDVMFVERHLYIVEACALCRECVLARGYPLVVLAGLRRVGAPSASWTRFRLRAVAVVAVVNKC